MSEISSASARHENEKLWVWAIAALIVGYAMVAASYLGRSLWYDEIVSFNMSRLGYAHNIVAYPAPNHHLLHTMLLGVMPHKAPEWLIRLPAFLGGLLSLITLAVLLLRRIKGWMALAGLCSVILLPHYLFFMTTARGYTLQLLGVLLLLLSLDMDTSGKRERLVWYLYIIASLLTVYTLPTGWVYWGVVSLVLMWQRKKRAHCVNQQASSWLSIVGPVALSTILLGLLYAPLLGQIIDATGQSDASLLQRFLTSLSNLGEPVSIAGWPWAVWILLAWMGWCAKGRVSGCRKTVFVTCLSIPLGFCLAWPLIGSVPFDRNYFAAFVCVFLGTWICIDQAPRVSRVTIIILLFGVVLGSNVGLWRHAVVEPTAVHIGPGPKENWPAIFKHAERLQDTHGIVMPRVPGAGSHLMGVSHYMLHSTVFAPRPEFGIQVANIFEHGGTVKLGEYRIQNHLSTPTEKYNTRWSESVVRCFGTPKSQSGVLANGFADFYEYKFTIPKGFQPLQVPQIKKFIETQNAKGGFGQIDQNHFQLSGSWLPKGRGLNKKAWTTLRQDGIGLVIYDVEVAPGTDILLSILAGVFQHSDKGTFAWRNAYGSVVGPQNVVQGWLLKKKLFGEDILISRPDLIIRMSSNTYRVFNWERVKRGESLNFAVRGSLGSIPTTIDLRVIRYGVIHQANPE